jgi:hypothetical protein
MSDRNIKGNLKIEKVYKDHTELVQDDHNVIVSGMSVGLASLFSESGSTSILDYQIVYSQLGTGTGVLDTSTFTLTTPVGNVSGYGGDTITDTLQPIENGSVVAAEAFMIIPHSNISKVNKTSVRFKIVLDETAGGSGVSFKEIGLFMKNHTGNAADRPLLVAYRTFSPITKESDFAIVFTWTITF